MIELPDSIAFWSVQEVAEDWNPRIASTQSLSLPARRGIQGWQYPGDVFNRWLNLFVGTYDATIFARLEEGKTRFVKYFPCTPWIVDDRVVGFEIVGEAFLWRSELEALRWLCSVYQMEL